MVKEKEKTLEEYVLQAREIIIKIQKKISPVGELNEELLKQWQERLNGILRGIQRKIFDEKKEKLLINEVEKIASYLQPQQDEKPEDIVKICDSILSKIIKLKKAKKRPLKDYLKNKKAA